MNPTRANANPPLVGRGVLTAPPDHPHAPPARWGQTRPTTAPPVPQGRPTIAQCFSAGSHPTRNPQVPKGRLNPTRPIHSSLRDSLPLPPNPVLKHWAIIIRPSGTPPFPRTSSPIPAASRNLQNPILDLPEAPRNLRNPISKLPDASPNLRCPFADLAEASRPIRWRLAELGIVPPDLPDRTATLAVAPPVIRCHFSFLPASPPTIHRDPPSPPLSVP